MFTGIVLGTATIASIEKKENFQTHTLTFPNAWLIGLEEGASVAHNGCCLTVSNIDKNLVSFDLIKETLSVTNLGQLSEGASVNIERAARFGDEIGGHTMSGHILCLAKVIEVIDSPNNKTIWMEIPQTWQRFLFTKGYIGIDGVSLTIGSVENNRFCVHLIPETLERTNLSDKNVGDSINIEIDPQTQAIVETVERVLSKRN